MTARPGMAVQIAPVMKFYLRHTDWKINGPGMLINFDLFSKEAGIVDFTTEPGLSLRGATITHLPDGNWKVTYNEPSQEPPEIGLNEETSESAPVSYGATTVDLD